MMQMNKNKDPAFLLYSSDFLTGVSDLTMTERGKYITLLCLQHQKGHLSNKTINLAVGKMPKSLLDKFQKDSDGNYFNDRLEEVINKREIYAKSRSKNGKKGGRPKKHSKSTRDNISKAYEKHTENENNYVVHNNNLELCTDIFPFSHNNNNNCMYIARTQEDSKQIKKCDNIEFAIIEYFARMKYESNPEDFIAYNKGRDWKGFGGEDVREDFVRYADRWETEHRRKRGECNWAAPII